MDTRRNLSAELAAVAIDLQGEADIRSTATRVVQHAADIIGGHDVAVVMGRGLPRKVLSASTAEAASADRSQVELAQGPSVAAMARRQPVVVDDLAADRRWGRWSGAVAATGLHSVLALPLGVGTSTFGALSLYSPRRRAFDRTVTTVAQVYARHASVAVASARDETNLRRAVDARHAIGQAQGILMERYGLTAEQAFALLRRGARDRDLTLSAQARRIVASRGGTENV